MAKLSLKKFLINIIEILVEFRRRLVIRLFYRLPILSTRRTIQHILNSHCSVSRFGDGELSMMLNDTSIGFQPAHPELSSKLKSVFQNNSNLLICLPRYLNTVSGCTKRCKKYWRNFGRYDNLHKKTVVFVRSTLGKKAFLGDALITRPYIDRQDLNFAQTTFAMLKQIWDGKDILIVEGTQTRLGVGNDLFCNVKSIKRILAPATNAFNSYNQILSAVKKNHTNELVLISLGPTATVLSADLSSCGIQAIDTGHIDIEYEWFLSKATSKTAIQGKYTNEASNGSLLTDCNNNTYLQQIICRIE